MIFIVVYASNIPKINQCSVFDRSRGHRWCVEMQIDFAGQFANTMAAMIAAIVIQLCRRLFLPSNRLVPELPPNRL